MASIWNNVDEVKAIIEQSSSRKDVITKLGRSPTTSTYRRLRQFERQHAVDTSHFKSKCSNPRYQFKRTLSHTDIFCKNSTASASAVKLRIKRDMLIDYVCTSCGNDGTWMGNPITLQLEHIDGDSTNHELSNLCYLCPNCHSQTSTYSGRNKARREKTGQSITDYRIQYRQSRIDANQPLVDAVRQANIDFTRRGWSKQVALILGKHPAKVKRWMVLYMKEEYDRAWHVTRAVDKVPK